MTREQPLDHAAPAASDLEHMVAGIYLEQPGHAVELGVLSIFEGLLSGSIDARREAHAAVEPEAVEVVAEIVMRGDVAPAAAPRIGAQAMCDAACKPRADMTAKGAVLRFVEQRPFQKARQVWRRPVAVHEGFGEADLPAADQAPNGLPAFDHDGGVDAARAANKIDRLAGRRDDAQRAGSGRRP